MNYPKYQTLDVSPDNTVYSFISNGPNGNFKIEVQFMSIQEKELFNLGFGVVTDNGEIDDTITLNNGDRNKILATVAGFLDNFLNKNPNSWVSFSGSTLKRTKLYHRAISINYETLVNQYKILGVLPGEFFVVETFNPTIEYKAFLIKKLTFGL